MYDAFHPEVAQKDALYILDVNAFYKDSASIRFTEYVELGRILAKPGGERKVANVERGSHYVTRHFPLFRASLKASQLRN